MISGLFLRLLPLTLLGLLVPSSVSAQPSGEGSTSKNPTVVMLKLAGPPRVAPPVQIELRAVSATAESTRIERSVQAPGWVELDLEPGTVWQLSTRTDDYWSAGSVVAPGPGGDSASLLLWPTGEVRGRLQPAHGESLPQELTVRFEPPPDAPTHGRITQSLLSCPVGPTGDWSCRLPAMALDLRIRAKGFISHFYWDLPIATDQSLDLGTLALQRGASLVGRVEDAAGGTLDPETTRVELSTPVAGAESGHRRSVRSVRLEKRGFFHFKNVPPGSYTVEARRPDSAPAAYPDATVLENAETELREPLILHPPLAAEIYVTPPFDLAKRPWSVDFLQLTDTPGLGKEIEGGVVSPEGLLVKRGLAPGRYLIQVQNSAGDHLAAEMVTLEADRQQFHLELEIVFVEGSLHLGDEPLPANLLFGGPFGAEKVQIPSDSDGQFFGMLPRDGAWEILIEAEEPNIHRFLEAEVSPDEGGIARLDLVVADTRLSGRVVDEFGEPVEQALVKALGPEVQNPSLAMTDSRGRFAFRGLPEGSNRIWAEHVDGDAPETSADLVPDGESILQLTIRKRHVVSGRMVGSGGAPLAGILIHGFPYDSTGRSLPHGAAQTTTDVRGRFELVLSAAAESMQVIAYPPGYALSLLPPKTTDELTAEPLEIMAQAPQGEVLLDLDPPLDFADPAAGVRLILRGESVGLGILETWRSIHGVRDPDASVYRIPALPPGPVVACRGADSSNACKNGFVSPDSVLPLKLAL